MVARKTRTSSRFPGLSLELQATERGTFATFRYGATFEAFQLAGGKALWIECSDRFAMAAAMVAHCRETARAYAAKLTPKKVA